MSSIKSDIKQLKQKVIDNLFEQIGNKSRLIDLCELFIDGDWIESKDQSESGIRLIQTGNVGIGKYKDNVRRARYISDSTFEKLDCKEIKEGDFLVSRLPDPVGRACILPMLSFKAITAVDCTIIRLKLSKIIPKYLLYFTLSSNYQKQVDKELSGTTRKRISRSKLATVLVPVTGLTEQNHIVQKIDKLIKLCDEIDQSGISLEDKLKELKSAILQSAIQGKLVPQDTNDEPAGVLLEKIKVEKSKLVKEGKIKKEKLLPEIKPEEIPFEIPSSWKWARMSDIFKFIDYRGKTPAKVTRGMRLITAKNVKKGYLNYLPEEFVIPNIYDKWMTRGIPQYNDILFTTEAPLGNVALLNIKEKAVFAQRIIVFQPFASIITKLYMYFILSSSFQKLLVEKQTGMTAKGIKSSRLKLTLIPLPPISEQYRIVQKVDELLEVITDLREKVIILKAEK